LAIPNAIESAMPASAMMISNVECVPRCLGIEALAEFSADLVLANQELPGYQTSALKGAVPGSPFASCCLPRNHPDDCPRKFAITPIIMPELVGTIDRALTRGP
jgi:hypothetical protein